MEIPVLIEPVAGNGYGARTGEPLALSAVGATRETALKNLEKLVSNRLSNGTQIQFIKFPDDDNPWLALAGMHDPNDPEVIA